uniref:Uncharacterized protein n=1 Tax=Lactuca sativa TaxID=4236 RepID=A0A9R1XLM6_LACSA|nr:hypothetical protein LSAT_V11C400161020 [Lactuca sativa]
MLIVKHLWGKGKGVRAPWWSYWSAGITNTIGPAMGIEALKYISYPAQEYLCSLLVAGGVSIFALAKTSSKTINKLANPNAPLGYGLCFLNLVFDGFTNATQDSISASRFGSLTNTTITTTRKFVSIVVSSVLSGNPLSRKQWGSVVMVIV